MDDRYMDILIEGERIPDDDDHFVRGPCLLDAPHSAPHSRSSSFKNRPRPKLNLDIQAAQRPRTNSLPNAHLLLPEPAHFKESHGLCRVRSFKTTSKGLINHGDSFKRSTNSLISAGSAGSITDGTKSPRRPSCVSNDSGPDSHSSSTTPTVYRVIMMGAPGVGKSALTRQFMTSEYKGTYAESNTPDIIEPERHVSVLLDGEESMIAFVDEEEHPDHEAEELQIDAFVVVFSVTDHSSYNYACRTLRKLREVERTNKAVILVGNKIDLARQRRITKHDALRLSKKFNCRYAETSAALNHHVDELLVGILSQIRQQLAPPSSPSCLHPPEMDRVRSRSKSPGRAISNFFSKIFGTSDKRAKSCETLFVQ